MASVLDSGFGASFKSMAIRHPEQKHSSPRPDRVPVTGSLPIRSSKPVPTLSNVFGKKQDAGAKSWSEMWEEEEFEQEEAVLRRRREQNARSWSQESQDDVTVRPGVLTESKSQSSLNARRGHQRKPASVTKQTGSPNENEPFGARGRASKNPPGKQTSADKWAALGNKRRNFQTSKGHQASSAKKRSMTTGWRKEAGLGSSGFDYGAWHRRDSRGGTHPAWLDQDWRRDQHPLPQPKSGSDGSAEDEWVGGWHAFHL